MHHLVKALCAKEVAKVVDVTRDAIAVQKEDVYFLNQDRAEVNRLATLALEVLYENACSLFCFSHTLDKAGSQLLDACSPPTRLLVAKWLKCVSKPAFLDAHSKFFGMSAVQFSETRWWSRFDVIQFLFRERVRLRTFLQTCVARGVCKKTAGGTAFVVFVCVFVFLLF
jgi:hypothetical protein